MPWVKLDDAILDNKKIAAVGPMGFALHVAGIVYCGRNLTDGFVPYGVATRLLSNEWVDGDEKVWTVGASTGMFGIDGAELTEHIIERVVRTGLWERVPGGYLIHDYLEYNPSREQVEAEREAVREQRSAAGKASAAVRRERYGTAQPERSPERAVRTADQTGVQTETRTDSERSPNPVPVPVPVPKSESPPNPLQPLLLGAEDVLGRVLSAKEIESVQSVVGEVRRLDCDGMVRHMRQTKEWREQNGLEPLRSVVGYLNALKREDRYLADQGVQAPRESGSRRDGGFTRMGESA